MKVLSVFNKFKKQTKNSYITPFCNYYFTTIAREYKSLRNVNIGKIICDQIIQVIPKDEYTSFILFLELAQNYYKLDLSDGYFINKFNKFLVSMAEDLKAIRRRDKSNRFIVNLPENLMNEENQYFSFTEERLLRKGIEFVRDLLKDIPKNTQFSDIEKSGIFNDKLISKNVLSYIAYNYLYCEEEMNKYFI